MTRDSLETIVARAVYTLDPELRRVVELLYALGGDPRTSRRQIARQLDLTTDQVHRAEKRTIRSLRHPLHSRPMRDALDASGEEIWNRLAVVDSATGSFVRNDQPENLLDRRLGGAALLAIRCLYTDVPTWPSSTSSEAEAAWFRSCAPERAVLEAAAAVSNLSRETVFPLLLEPLLETLRIDGDALSFALCLISRSFAIHGPYLTEAVVDTDCLRAIRLHLLLPHEAEEHSQTVETLVDAYNLTYEDDEVTEDLARAAMAARPELFSASPDSSTWSARGRVAAPPDQCDEGRSEVVPGVFGRSWADTTAADIVTEILHAQGICRRSQIMRDFKARTAGRFSLPSITAALDCSKEIVVLAPRVYGLRGLLGSLSPDAATCEILLTASDCRAYAIDRFSGEPLRAYPLWTPAMERDWCHWAEGYADRGLFESLLYVAHPQGWDAPDHEKQSWEFKKQTLGRFTLTIRPKHTLSFEISSLQDLLACTLHAKALGYLNWIQANVATGRERHSPKGAAPLSLLVALGVLEPTHHWMLRHELGPEANGFLEAMRAQVLEKGFVHWKDSVGATVRARLLSTTKGAHLGWIDSAAPKDAAGNAETSGGARRPAPGLEKPGARQLGLPF